MLAFLIAIAPFIRVGQCETQGIAAVGTSAPVIATAGRDGIHWGGWQFDDLTWRATTGLPGHASNYSIVVQLEGAVKLERERGWSPWPVCGRRAYE